MANPHLQWTLMALVDPASRFGVWLDPVTELAAYSYLEERAQAFVFRRGIYDTHLGEEALHNMLIWAAESEIAFKYRADRGSPRQFILMKLDKAVCLCIRKKYRHVVRPLAEGLQSREINPATAAELSDLKSVCLNALTDIGDDVDGEDGMAGAAVIVPHDKPKTPGSAKATLTSTDYVHRHRARKLRWLKIQPHFPEIKDMRPRPWQSRRRTSTTRQTQNRPHGASCRLTAESSVSVSTD